MCCLPLLLTTTRSLRRSNSRISNGCWPAMILSFLPGLWAISPVRIPRSPPWWLKSLPTHACRLELKRSPLARLAALLVLALPLASAFYALALGSLVLALPALLLALLLWLSLRRRQPVTALWLDEERLLAVEWCGHYWPVCAAAPARRLGWLLWWPLCWQDQPAPAGAPERVVLWCDALPQWQWRLAQRLALRPLAAAKERAARGPLAGHEP